MSEGTDGAKAPTAGARYMRRPLHDKRFSRGDHHAADGWLDTWTGMIVWGVVGYDYNTTQGSPKGVAPDISEGGEK